MKCFVELCQSTNPQFDETLTQPEFVFNTSIHHEVHYLPNNLYFNLKSHGPVPLFLSPNSAYAGDFRRNLLAVLSCQTLIPQSNFNFILNSVSKKVNSVTSEFRHTGGCTILFSLSIRAIHIESFSLEARLIWEKMLPLDIDGKNLGNFPATEKSVGALEAVVYREDGDYCLNVSECAICLKEFQEGEVIKRMNCFHVYHRECIDEWLLKSHLCPCCRSPMPVCRVVEGSFPFYRRLTSGAPPAVGGKIRKPARKPRMSVRNPVY